jgi:MFS family permease
MQLRRGERRRTLFAKPAAELLNSTGLVMLAAIAYFEASGPVKSLLASTPHMGLLLGPVLVAGLTHWRILPATAIAVVIMLIGCGLVVAGLAASLWLFVLGVVAAGLAFGCLAPLVAAMWRQNAPAQFRGQFLSRCLIIGSLSALVVTGLVSWWLSWVPNGFGEPLIGVGIALLLTGWSYRRLPSQPLGDGQRSALAGVLTPLLRDRLFAYICLTWYILGFGNLLLLPLRAQFAAGSDGLALPPWQALVAVAVIPEALSLLTMTLWGRMFDRMNFIVVRMLINVFFGTSCFITFTGPAWGLLVGSVLFGIAKGGGQVAWSLWVTKFAPPDRTADYMATHTFLTGTRGVLSAWVAFGLLGTWFSFQQLSWIGGGLVSLATLMLVPVIAHGRR